MDWGSADFHYYSNMEEYLLRSPRSEMEERASEWTFEENKLFENALGEIDPNSPAFLENVASRIPWKSMDDVKNHYQSLIEDVEMIESGRVPLPDYPDHFDADDNKKAGEGPSNLDLPKTRATAHQRRRGVPWTEEEHQLFLMGLNKYGKGDWRSISRYYVISKTPTQVASHAQKYFRRQNSSTPADRRRPSIHDIQTVNPTPTPIPNRATVEAAAPPLPNFPSLGLFPPPIMNAPPNPMFMDMGMGDSAANAMGMGMNINMGDSAANAMGMGMGMNGGAYPFADDFYNHNFVADPAAASTSATVYPSYFVPPSMMNQQYWGGI